MSGRATALRIGMSVWLCVCGFLEPTVMAQVPPRSASAGVFATEQVKRGESVYAANCALCHRADMGGKEPAPELAGDKFMSKWRGKSVGELFARTRTTMPMGKGGSLSDHEYLDVVAMILDANGFPSGTQVLPAVQAELDAITLK